MNNAKKLKLVNKSNNLTWCLNKGNLFLINTVGDWKYLAYDHSHTIASACRGRTYKSVPVIIDERGHIEL